MRVFLRPPIMYLLPTPSGAPPSPPLVLRPRAAALLAAILVSSPEKQRRLCLQALADDETLRHFVAWSACSTPAAPRASLEPLADWLCEHLAQLASQLSPLPPGSDVASSASSRSASALAAAESPLPPEDELTMLLAERLPELAKQAVEWRSLRGEFTRTVQTAKLAALKELAYGASHEINNPLANISTRAQLLLRDETHPERRRMLEVIQSQAMRANEMIADLMFFARPPRPNRASVSLGSLARKVLEEWREQAQAQSTKLEGDLGEEAIEIQADPVQLGLAISALVRNALEALGQGGEVRLAFCAENEAVCLTVADNGPGIPPDVLPKIFDPFFSGREAGRGLGFGLTKAWQIARQHGGSLAVETQVGQGARFALRLPRS